MQCAVMTCPLTKIFKAFYEKEAYTSTLSLSTYLGKPQKKSFTIGKAISAFTPPPPLNGLAISRGFFLRLPLLTYWSICLHKTLEPNLKLFSGFQACFFTCSLRGLEHPLFIGGLDVLAVWWPEPGAGGGRCQSPSGSWSPWTRWWLLGRRIWRRYA